MYRFITPFYYLNYSRLKSLPEKLSLIFIFPLFLMVFIFGFYPFGDVLSLFSYILLFFSWMCIYEIGYLENDTYTIRREIKPNLRIGKNEINFITSNFNYIVFFRVIFFILSIGVLGFLQVFKKEQIGYFIVAVIISSLFFFIHNRIRSKWNILTYFFLCVCKYWVFPLVYLGFNHGFEPYVIILICFPLLRTMEHAVKPKYELIWLKKNFGSLDYFRVKYYMVVVLISLLISFGFGFTNVFIYSAFYFFIYRASVMVMIRSGQYTREVVT